MGRNLPTISLMPPVGPLDPRVDRLPSMFCPEEPLTKLRIWLRKLLSPALLTSPPSVAAAAVPRPDWMAVGDSPSRDASACFISGVTRPKTPSKIEVAIDGSPSKLVCCEVMTVGREYGRIILCGEE